MLSSAHVLPVIPVSDLSRARAFYEKMLGLKPQEVYEGGGEVVYSIGDSSLLVYQTRASRGRPPKWPFS